ncbi:hypothetical protein MWN52_15105 [Pseudoxanthomonas winnipegensis]|uniref:hypothetical protein n=1 Tax=Pseudoxanthomonas winnipegensis TaxID=2480810 RepID=UPI0025750916|nr:hypothetical protein [Pseudoxanthomonas winnipegensis]WJI14938.1 hypothetical protein MWN52_15105 [Pseudoxanthomonas winnipegensis]
MQSEPPKRSTGKIVLWTLAAVIGVPVVLFVGSAVVAGIMEASDRRAAPQAKPYTGRLRVDSGTMFVLRDQPTSLGGACAGWNTVSMERPDGSDAMTNLMCWRRDGDTITVTTEKGDMRKTHPASMLTD